MAWSWVSAQLSGMAAGEFKQLNTNAPWDVALARTRANFDAGSTWASDAAVSTAIVAASLNSFGAYSSPAINFATGQVRFRGGGHADGGDSSIFAFNPATSFAWVLAHKGAMYDSSGADTITASVSGATQANPVVITTSAAHGFKIGDSVSFASVGGMTELNGNTYQVTAVGSSTTFSLANRDGTYSQKYTNLNGTGFTAYTSGGTASVVRGTNSVDGSNYYAYPNVDGNEMPPCTHTYHWKWVGDNRYLLSGTSVFAPTGGLTPNRIWILDEDATPQVYRGYHDPTGGEPTADAQTNYGGPWYNGPYAYDETLGRVYGFSSEVAAKNFNFRVFSWEAGQSTDSDFQRVYSLEFDGSNGGQEGYDCCSLPQVGTPAQRAIFALHSTTEFNYCLDIGGTATMSVNTFSDGAIFSTDMADLVAIGVCYDDLNDSLVYWGGGATLGEITTSSTLSSWTTAELTPATPTGDLPSRTGYPVNAGCAICKVPGEDAYLLARGGEVWLYARGSFTGGGGGTITKGRRTLLGIGA